jgi:GTP cyclohydrolase-4
MYIDLPDVQSEVPKIRLKINRVGLINVRIPLEVIGRSDGYVLQNSVFSVFVNLPANQRGIHASRSYESIYEVLSSTTWKTAKLEDISKYIVEKLLEKHEYSDWAEGNFRAELYRTVKSPVTRKDSLERFMIRAGATGWRKENKITSQRHIGVTVSGITACPCAQEMIKKIITIRGEQASRRTPIATHMQRTFASVDLRLVGDESVDLVELGDIVKTCLSAPTYDLLKRADEAYLVMDAVKNPVFVEDAVRIIALRIAESFPRLSPRTEVKIVVKSVESIHNHDFAAKLKTNLEEIRKNHG